jgi:hypothetical protein
MEAAVVGAATFAMLLTFLWPSPLKVRGAPASLALGRPSHHIIAPVVRGSVYRAQPNVLPHRQHAYALAAGYMQHLSIDYGVDGCGDALQQ